MNNVRVNIVDRNGNRYGERRHNGARYVIGGHESQYAIELKSNLRRLACVSIDGERIGDFVLDAHRASVIKRPVSTDRSFHFIKRDSREGDAILSEVSRNSLGLIQVDFYDEYEVAVSKQLYETLPNGRKRPLGLRRAGRSNGTTKASLSAAGTGLGDSTGQRYGRASFQRVESSKYTVYLRLTVEDTSRYDSVSSSNTYPSPI